jgi:hypothetical protein
MDELLHGQYYSKFSKNIFISGYSSSHRNEAIYSIENTIDNFGFIIDFKTFSDISISFIISIEENKITQLYDKLSELIVLDSNEIPYSESAKERIVFLKVTFTKASGKFKNEIPSVPG